MRTRLEQLYCYVCERALLPLADVVSQRSIARMFKLLEATQSWSPEKLRSYQNNRVREVVRFAYQNTKYFQTVMDNRGVRPNDVRSTDDLVRFPLMTKTLIREKGMAQLIAPTRQRLIKSTTSGSTGEQGTFYLSKEAESLTYAAVLLFFKWAGYRAGDAHTLTGITIDRGIQKSLKDFIFRCHYVSAFGLTDRGLAQIVSRIRKKRVKILAGYASSLYSIASFAASRGETLQLNTVISLGDTLYGHYRKRIETAFQCQVFDTYGCCEGFQIAAQCPEMNYHVCMPLTFVEILDEKGRRLPAGNDGRVVLTRLDLNPMPLIRYEIGDVAALSTSENCRCGRNWQILDSIRGRDTDIIVTPNGHRLIVHFFTAIFENEPSIRQFQVVQNRREEICIRVVPGDNFTMAVLYSVEQKILKKCDHDLKVTFKVVNDIPPTTSGKRRFVISEVSRTSHAASTQIV